MIPQFPISLARIMPPKYLRLLGLLGLFTAVFLGSAALASVVTNPMTITIDATQPGQAIASNFVGIAVSSWSIDDDQGYTKYFTTNYPQMVALFRQIGVKHIRTIMGSASAANPDPSNSDIDAFFNFAAAAGVNKVIWSLHLFNAEAATNWANNRAVAQHIWTTTTSAGVVESNLLESFAFDNEPDWLGYICCTDPEITGYYTPTSTGGYSLMWSNWQQTISALAPGVKFSGPDSGSKYPVPGDTDTAINGVPFTLRFAQDQAANLATANQHYYAGGPPGTDSVETMAETCLSTNFLLEYSNFFNGAVAGSPHWPKAASGGPLPYRFTECTAFDNDTNIGNQCFATALWGLDFYHWWAMQPGCVGVDPFTRAAQYNAPIYYNGSNYIAVAYAYGMKAFNLGASGNAINPAQFAIANPSNANVTAYGVVNGTDLFVTVVNKTFTNVGAVAAQISIPAPRGFSVVNARALVLSAGPTAGVSGNATMDGACLGGAEIPNDGTAWAGTWTTLPVTNGAVSLLVQPTTGVIIDLQNDGGPVATTTTVNNIGPWPYGHSVVVSAAVSPVPSGGTVQFYTNGAAWGGPLNASSGDVAFGTNSLSAGTYQITAAYSGTTGYAASSTANPVVLQITPAMVDLTPNPVSKVYGATLVFGAGSANFSATGLVNGDTIGTVTLTDPQNGGAAAAPVGSYPLAAALATGGTFNPANYLIDYIPGSLAVTLPPNTVPVNITAGAVINGAAQLGFSGTPGFVYWIESTTNLGPSASWTILGTAAADSNGNFSFTDPGAATNAATYYRTMAQ